jgi:large subunit ribosomal protein L18
MHIKQKVLALRENRKKRVRAKMEGSASKPRINVTRSNNYMFVQAIDDVAGKTIVGMRDGEEKGTKTERAAAIAKKIAAHLQKENITEAIFDRGPYKYHGRVKAVAEALRGEGIKV